MAELIAASLSQQIIDTQSKVDRGIDKLRADLYSLESRHERALQEFADNKEALKRTREELVQRLEEGRGLSEKSQEELEALEREVMELRLKEETLPKELEAMRQREVELREALEKKRAEVTAFLEQRSDYVNTLTKGLLMYKHFGLDFERAGTRLRLVFTQLDPSSPQREFFFSLNVDERDQYDVPECQPPLPPHRLAALLSVANASNDFAGFVKGMRREFKAALGAN